MVNRSLRVHGSWAQMTSRVRLVWWRRRLCLHLLFLVMIMMTYQQILLNILMTWPQPLGMQPPVLMHILPSIFLLDHHHPHARKHLIIIVECLVRWESPYLLLPTIIAMLSVMYPHLIQFLVYAIFLWDSYVLMALYCR